MATYQILDCKSGACAALGTIDVADATKAAVLSSADGDLSVDVVPFYISGGPGVPGKVIRAISVNQTPAATWKTVQGFKPTQVAAVKKAG